jgi:hypothetical protein
MLLFMAAAPAADAVMYRWIDENGSLTYSDQMPMDPSKVRGLTVIDTPAPPSQFERRARELIEADKRSGESTALDREPQSSPRLEAGSEPDAGARDMLGRDADPQPRAGSVELPGSPRASTHPRAEAVRDPCLRSADPKCHEKNRNAYVPYLGYAPSAARAARSADVLTGVGATTDVTGTGAIGAAVGAAPAPVTTPRRSQTWQPRHSLRDAKDLK